MKLKTFRIGGIHPAARKLSAGKPVETAALPRQAVVMLSQHIGAPAQAVVAKGDRVKTGTLIAKADGFVSANIHSPVSGTVVKTDRITDASGYSKPAVFIQTEGDEWEESIDRDESLRSECSLSPAEIIQKIADCGIVGLGGATFPTHVKLSPPPGMKATVLIVNAAECEPYLTSDHALMLEKSEEILVGIQILKKAIQVERAVIGIENNKKDAIDRFRRLLPKYPGIDLCPLRTRYPQGGEKQLIDAVIRRQVPSGGLPVATGAVVQNAGTVFAVYEAVQKNKPLFERVVTVTGNSLERPAHYRVRIGTPVGQLIEAAGGIPEDTGKIISGGPMMGKALVNTDVPVTKGCSGILLLPRKEAVRREMSNCIRCARCVSACPMGLEPNLLMNLSYRSRWEEAEREHIMDCIECGSCSYICPAHRPVLDYVRLGKGKAGSLLRSRKAPK